MASNEQFLKHLEKDYPSTDWNHLPDLETSPDVWKIHGTRQRRRVFLSKQKEFVDTLHFEIADEYLSYEDAKAQVEAMKKNPAWAEEILAEDRTHRPMPSLEYLGPVNFDNIEIRKTKKSDLLNLHIMKTLRDQVLKGEKVFPLSLP